ncbi:MAG: hypothetical protein AAFQ41_17140, partial [Cyanobacteria bacterium J06623_7]
SSFNILPTQAIRGLSHSADKVLTINSYVKYQQVNRRKIMISSCGDRLWPKDTAQTKHIHQFTFI